MSADAKIWQRDQGDGWTSWEGIHDGAETTECAFHRQGGVLSNTIKAVEKCAGDRPMRWEFRTYPDGTCGLVGYHA